MTRGRGDSGATRVTTHLDALQFALKARRLLTYRDSGSLVICDPELSQDVVITRDSEGWSWPSPSGRHYAEDPGAVADGVLRDYGLVRS